MISFFVLLPVYTSAETSAPAWFLNTHQTKTGSKLKTTCSGSGPSLYLARRSAEADCIATAIDHVPGDITFKSRIIETEKELAVHSESTRKQIFSGLECKSKKEEIRELNDSYTAYLLCEFDLSKLKSKTISESAPKTDRKRPKSSYYGHDNTDQIKKGRTISGNKKTLLIESIPACDSILILGHESRVIHCNQNPMPVDTITSDYSLVIRALKHLPVKIENLDERKSNESIQVFLQPL